MFWIMHGKLYYISLTMLHVPEFYSLWAIITVILAWLQ